METTTKERPILMRGDMIRATFADRKRQTRRIVKNAIHPDTTEFVLRRDCAGPGGQPVDLFVPQDRFGRSLGPGIICPHGKPGDRLWVRETFFCNSFDYPEPTEHARENLYYRADWGDGEPEMDGESITHEGGGWKPSIHMPRWASRLTLEIVNVRVERVRDISEADAIAEGCRGYRKEIGFDEERFIYPLEQFEELWDSLNAKRGSGWGVNPWCFVIEFRRVDAPINDDPFGDGPDREESDDLPMLTLDERMELHDDDMGSRDVEREEGHA